MNRYNIWMIVKDKLEATINDWVLLGTCIEKDIKVEMGHIHAVGGRPSIFVLSKVGDDGFKTTFDYSLTKLRKVIHNG